MPHKRAKRSIREQQRKERGADLAPPSGNNRTGISTERIPKSVARVLDAARIRTEYRQKRARQETDANDNDPGAPKPPPSKKRRRDARAGADESKVSGKKKGTGGPNGTTTIQIQSGESLKHFNRRVEDHMRPLVQSAMRASAATERKGRRAAAPNKTHRASSPPSLASSATGKKSKAHADDAPPSSLATGLTTRDDDDGDRPKEFATTSSAAPRRLNDIAMAPPELKRLPRGAAKHPAGGNVKATKAGAGVLSMAQRAMMEVEREKAIRRYREMKERKAMEGDRTFSLGGEGPAGGGG